LHHQLQGKVGENLKHQIHLVEKDISFKSKIISILQENYRVNSSVQDSEGKISCYLFQFLKPILGDFFDELGKIVRNQPIFKNQTESILPHFTDQFCEFLNHG
jgi:hypothetical protein